MAIEKAVAVARKLHTKRTETPALKAQVGISRVGYEVDRSLIAPNSLLSMEIHLSTDGGITWQRALSMETKYDASTTENPGLFMGFGRARTNKNSDLWVKGVVRMRRGSMDTEIRSVVHSGVPEVTPPRPAR